jgi:hypothetical protein
MNFTKKMQKKILLFLLNPLYSFFFYLAIISFIALMPDKGDVIAFLVFGFPWFVIIIFFLNLPFFGAAFRGFTLSENKKRNHALEHGTVHFLTKRYGKTAKVGGKAKHDGFRISGVRNRTDIQTAFKEMLDALVEKNTRNNTFISQMCGSNVCTAQAFGMISLTLTGILSMVLGISGMFSLGLLILNVLIYFLLRHRLGLWIQRRLFLSLDFENAKIELIRSVPKKILEHNHVYFVKTMF